MRRSAIPWVLLLFGTAISPWPAAARPVGSPDANESLTLCERADYSTGYEQDRLLADGLAVAQRVLAADETDAAAHFAVFCNLGKQLRLAGVRLSSLARVQWLRYEIDRALELAPNDPDLLTAKGALLLELPRVLGGDAVQGTNLLRRALATDPDNPCSSTWRARRI